MCVDHTSIAIRDTYKYLVSKINDSYNIRLRGESISLAKGEPTHIDTVFSIDDEIEVTFRVYDAVYSSSTGKIESMRVKLQSVNHFVAHPTDSATTTYTFHSMFSIPESAKERLMDLVSCAAAR